MMTKWTDILSLMGSAFLFVAYVLVMSQIVIDLFRDQDLSGGKKALWIVALILFPFLAALVYIVTRGMGMAKRARASAERRREEAVGTLREASPTSVDQIVRAKTLLDQGVINNEEFVALKRGALARAAG